MITARATAERLVDTIARATPCDLVFNLEREEEEKLIAALQELGFKVDPVQGVTRGMYRLCSAPREHSCPDIV